MAVWLKSLFPKYTVAYASPDQDRQALVRMASKDSGHTVESVGIPGLTIYRTACPRWKGVGSTAQASDGYTGGRTNSTYDVARMVRVRPVYTVKAWTRRLEDRDGIERVLAFAENYKTVKIIVPVGNGNTIGTDSPIEAGDPTYQHVPDAETGVPIWYGLQLEYQTSSAWLQTHQDPMINEILMSFEFMTTGTPIPDSVFELITVSMGSMPGVPHIS